MPFACEAPAQDPPVLPYLRELQRRTWDVQLAADIVPAGCSVPHRVASTNFNTMWVGETCHIDPSFALAYLTDFFASLNLCAAGAASATAGTLPGPR